MATDGAVYPCAWTALAQQVTSNAARPSSATELVRFKTVTLFQDSASYPGELMSSIPVLGTSTPGPTSSPTISRAVAADMDGLEAIIPAPLKTLKSSSAQLSIATSDDLSKSGISVLPTPNSEESTDFPAALAHVSPASSASAADTRNDSVEISISLFISLVVAAVVCVALLAFGIVGWCRRWRGADARQTTQGQTAKDDLVQEMKPRNNGGSVAVPLMRPRRTDAERNGTRMQGVPPRRENIRVSVFAGWSERLKQKMMNGEGEKRHVTFEMMSGGRASGGNRRIVESGDLRRVQRG